MVDTIMAESPSVDPGAGMTTGPPAQAEVSHIPRSCWPPKLAPSRGATVARAVSGLCGSARYCSMELGPSCLVPRDLFRCPEPGHQRATHVA